MNQAGIIGILARAFAVLVLATSVAQVSVPLPVVPLPVVPRSPSNTDGFLRQQDNLNRLLEDQQRTRQRNLLDLQEQDRRRRLEELERRRKMPVAPYDRPVGAQPLTP